MTCSDDNLDALGTSASGTGLGAISTTPMTSPTRVRWKRLLFRLATFLLVIWMVLLVVGYFVQDSLVFPRGMIPVSAYNGPVPSDVEVITLQTPEGDVPAWLLSGNPGAGLVVYLHGNGGVIDRSVSEARRLRRLGWHVVLPEYRGYGRAAGSPSQASISADITAVVGQVRARPEVDGPLVLYGRSIGADFAATLAESLGADGLILQTPPASIRQMAAAYLMPGFLVRSPLDAVAALRAMEPVPTVVLEHAQDTMIPSSQIAQVVAASNAVHVIVDGTHNGYGSREAQAEAQAAVDALLGRVMLAEGG